MLFRFNCLACHLFKLVPLPYVVLLMSLSYQCLCHLCFLCHFQHYLLLCCLLLILHPIFSSSTLSFSFLFFLVLLQKLLLFHLPSCSPLIPLVLLLPRPPRWSFLTCVSYSLARHDQSSFYFILFYLISWVLSRQRAAGSGAVAPGQRPGQHRGAVRRDGRCAAAAVPQLVPGHLHGPNRPAAGWLEQRTHTKAGAEEGRK